MAYDKIIEQLNTLKSIKPDESFKDHTKQVIFETVPEQRELIPTFAPQWSWAIGFAAVLLAVIAGSQIFSSPSQISSFNAQELEQELNSLNIEIGEIDYRNKTNETIASALDEISNTQASHLNRSILEQEQNNLNNINGNGSNDIDQMLDKVIF